MSGRDKNSRIAAGHLPAQDLVMKAPREPKIIDRMELLGMAAQVAGDTICVRNSRWPGGQKHFPYEPLLRTCEKFFDKAKGGPLYIDEPRTLRELEHCRRKAIAMRQEGLRYVYIARDEQGLDPSVEEVLAQLEEAPESPGMKTESAAKPAAAKTKKAKGGKRGVG